MPLDTAAGTGDVDQSTGDDDLDLRGSLEAAFVEHGAEIESDSINHVRERDETGKFKAKVKDVPVATAASTPSATAQTPAGTQSASPTPSAANASVVDPNVATIQPPAAWSAEAKAKWANVPADVQKIIAEREAEVHKGFTRLDEDRTLGKSMRDTLTPYMATINALGATPQQAVQSLLNADHVLRNGNAQQKTQLFSQLAQQFGVDLSAVVQGAPRPDATVAALQQRVDQLTTYINTQQTDAQQYTQRTILSEIEAFKADKPHFETLRPMMAVLMQNGQANTLQEAYDQAFRAHPSTSNVWIEDQVKARTQTQADAIRNRTGKAKSAAVSVSGAPGANSNTPVVHGTLREELEAQMREQGFRI